MESLDLEPEVVARGLQLNHTGHRHKAAAVAVAGREDEGPQGGGGGEGADERGMVKARSFGLWLLRFLWSQVTFSRVHFLYFIVSSLLGGLILWGLEYNTKRPPLQGPKPDDMWGRMGYMEAVASISAASCVTGMGFIDFEHISEAGKALHVVFMWLGGVPTIMLVPIILKLLYLRKHFWTAIKKRQGTDKFKNLFYEYEALWFLMIIVICYTIGLILIGFLVLALYANLDKHARHVIIHEHHANPTWWAFFHINGAFFQAGFPFFSDGLFQFNTCTVPVLILFAEMALGSTALPFLLRVIVWAMWKITRRPSFKFLLVYPRECCTHLFPAIQSRILVVSWLAMLFAQMLLFPLLDIHDPAVLHGNGWERFLITLLESINTRATGFPVVDVSQAHQAYQFIILLFMTTSAYPFIVSLRSTEKAHSFSFWKSIFVHDYVAENVARDASGRRSTELLPSSTDSLLDMSEAAAFAMRSASAPTPAKRSCSIELLSSVATGMVHTVISDDEIMQRRQKKVGKEAASARASSGVDEPAATGETREDILKRVNEINKQYRKDKHRAWRDKWLPSRMRKHKPRAEQQAISVEQEPKEGARNTSESESGPSGEVELQPVRPSGDEGALESESGKAGVASDLGASSATANTPEAPVANLFMQVTEVHKTVTRDVVWCIVLIAVVLVAEQGRQWDDPGFNIFKVIFEVLSAYAGVGISLGYCVTLPETTSSLTSFNVSSSSSSSSSSLFSDSSLTNATTGSSPAAASPTTWCANGGFAQTFSTASLICMSFALWAGRMRGFPESLDSAVQL
eukprot:TRINITY_DN1415_c0_g1_i11.p1 TRINITY_DN1415_c0_g1~~TRINITY_DN1415_c0_g1_i11.p1  ORF type:complete len:929 (-),score=186.30 TRINITY_DN1415_c0_g1_i11:652-3054(-)